MNEMAAAKRGLGKGLGALFDDFEHEATGTYLEVDIHSLDPNPKQPRKTFDAERLAELAASIKQHGIVQPILVRDRGDRYTIVAGERRWRAAQLAELKEVPVIVRVMDDQQLLEVSLIENIQRNDLNPLEEAAAIKFLMEQHDLTHEEVAERLGKSRPAITNAVRLLNLPEPVQDVVLSGELSAGHARALLTVSDPGHCEGLARRIINEGLSVRAAEALVKTSGKEKKPAGPKRTLSPDMFEAQERLQEHFGTRVKLIGDEARGRLIIDYYSRDQLEELYQRFCGV